MPVIALVVSVLAFAFTIASFWWLNARRGSVAGAVPPVYAFVKGFRLRFPVAVFNDGAVALLITDLRIVVSDAGTFPWQTTRTKLKPASDDGHEFATPFSVKGRDTTQIIAEFGGDFDWRPEPGATHQIRLEGMVHSENAWTEFVTFTWWAPHADRLMNNYIVHRNEPLPDASSDAGPTTGL
jgi:hypothetical protein